MPSYPIDLYYTKDHEWVRVDGERGTIGITEHAQEQLGDVVYVELPQPGATFAAGAVFGSVESVKAVSELYMPVSGEVVEVNEELASTPELVNTDPHGRGWMIAVTISDPQEIAGLMHAGDYEKYAHEEGGE